MKFERLRLGRFGVLSLETQASNTASLGADSDIEEEEPEPEESSAIFDSSSCNRINGAGFSQEIEDAIGDDEIKLGS